MLVEIRAYLAVVLVVLLATCLLEKNYVLVVLLATCLLEKNYVLALLLAS